MAAWIRAPSATTSSTFTPVRGGLPAISVTYERTMGMPVEPPTKRTPSSRCQSSPASPNASSVKRRVRSIRGNVIASNSARASSKLCLWVPSCRLIRVEARSESAHLACSLRTKTSLRANGSSSGSTPVRGELLGQKRGDPVVPVLAA